MRAELLIVLAFVAGTTSTTSLAQTERDLKRRFCDDMVREYRFPDRTRADCISGSHAIEIEFSENWAEAIGQALHYSLWTNDTQLALGPRKAGIILVCRNKNRDTCTDHYVRLFRVVEEFDLPVTIWDCDLTDMTLDACQMIDMPRQTRSENRSL